MNYIEFARKWVEEHCETSELYGKRIGKSVLELAETLDSQHNSGSSGAVVLRYFNELNKAYSRQEL